MLTFGHLQCKHLLAVIIAHTMGREVKTSVGLQGVVGLLGMSGATRGDGAAKEQQ